MPHEYEIIVTGDDYMQTKIYLTPEEHAAFMKVVNSLEKMGPYTASIIVKDLTAQREKALEDARKAVEEERKRFLQLCRWPSLLHRKSKNKSRILRFGIFYYPCIVRLYSNKLLVCFNFPSALFSIC